MEILQTEISDVAFLYSLQYCNVSHLLLVGDGTEGVGPEFELPAQQHGGQCHELLVTLLPPSPG